MDEARLGDLRKELDVLEAEEARLSGERARLHDQLDFGYGSERSRAREREISTQRRQLHRRIKSLTMILAAYESSSSTEQPAP